MSTSPLQEFTRRKKEKSAQRAAPGKKKKKKGYSMKDRIIDGALMRVSRSNVRRALVQYRALFKPWVGLTLRSAARIIDTKRTTSGRARVGGSREVVCHLMIPRIHSSARSSGGSPQLFVCQPDISGLT